MSLESKLSQNSIFGNVLWEFFSTGLARTIGFLTFIILAKLLGPEDFGLFACVQIVLSFAVLVQDVGINQTVIKSRDKDIADSAFFVNLIFGITIYFVVFFFSPYISDFFNKDQLTNILRVATISFFFVPYISIQNALLAKELRFKEASLFNTIYVLSSSVFSIILAVSGKGVWSFIYGHIIGCLIETLVMIRYAQWKPTIRFDRRHIKELLMYGGSITINDIVSWITSSFDDLLVGRFLGTASLGLYRVGFNIGRFPSETIAGAINKVYYSVFSRLQNNKDELKSSYLTSLKYLALVLLPAGISIIIFSEDIVTGLLGVKWKGAVIVIQLISVYGILAGFGGNATLVLRATGKAGLTMKIQMLRAPVLILAYLYSAPRGLFAISLSHAVIIALFIPVYIYITMKEIDINPWEGLKVFVKPTAALLPFLVVVNVLRQISIGPDPALLNLLIILPAGIVSYVVTVVIIDVELRGEFKKRLLRC